MGKRIITLLKYIANGILDIIFPPEEICISCLEDGYVGLCPKCFKNIKRIRNINNSYSYSYGYYVGPLKALILSFKYKENYLAAEILGEFLCQTIKENNIKYDVILYVPLSKKSKKKRGFNQCQILANKVSEKYNIPISKSLVKIRETREQKILSKEDRKSNIADAFDIINANEILNKNVLLIDDVATTGVTGLECEKVLMRYGAKKVSILTVAQSFI